MAGVAVHECHPVRFIAGIGWASDSGKSFRKKHTKLQLIFELQLDNIGSAFPSDSQWQYWVINAVTLVQAALGPIFSSISDVFQARKSVLVGLTTLAFIGAAIAPGSQSIYRLIGASTMIGFGLAAAPLTYAVPSEIVPRRWRSGEYLNHYTEPALRFVASQGFINLFAGLGAVTGPLVSE